MYDCLIASGCSHTYGSEMGDVDKYSTQPSKYAWPQQLGNYLNIPKVYNEATGGAGNDYIVRTIIKKVEQCKDKKILVGIMFSVKSRFEYIKKNDDGDYIDRIGIWCKDVLPRSHWILKYFNDGQHDFKDNYEALKNLHYIQLYLKDKNIDYFIINSFKYHAIDYSASISNDNVNRFNNIIDKSVYFSTTINNIPVSAFRDWVNFGSYKSAIGGHYTEQYSIDFVNEALGPWVRDKFNIGEK